MFSKLLQNREKVDNSTSQGYVSYKNDEAIKLIENEYENYGEIPKDVDVVFAKNLKENNGNFIYCKDHSDILHKLSGFLSVNSLFPLFVAESNVLKFLSDYKEEYSLEFERNLDFAKVSLSMCEYGVAEDGTLILDSFQNNLRTANAYPTIQVFIVFKNQLRQKISHAVHDFNKKHNNTVRPFILSTKENQENGVRFVNNGLTIKAKPAEHLFVFYCQEDYNLL